MILASMQSNFGLYSFEEGHIFMMIGNYFNM